MNESDPASSPTLLDLAANRMMMIRRGNPSMSGPHPGDISNADDLLRRLGLDPDMTVIELQRRLAIAERAISGINAAAVGIPVVGGAQDMLDYIATGKPYAPTSENSETPA